MENKERDFLNKIKDQTEDVNIPESLEPEKIEELLKGKRQKQSRRRSWTAGLAVAASLVLVAGVVYGLGGRNLIPGTDKSGQEKGNKTTDVGKTEGMKTAKSYEEIFENMQTNANSGGIAQYAAGDTGNKEVAMDSAASDSAAPRSQAASDYSETNVRQQGVDEADVVKTDGRYLYTLGNDGTTVSIVDTKDSLAVVGKVESESGTILELYLKDNRLILVCSSGEYYGVMPLARDGAKEQTTTISTNIITYDVTDVKAPKKLGEVTQSGAYSTSRMEGDYVYILSRYFPDMNAKKDQTDAFIPYINGKILPESQIYLPGTDGSSYDIVTSVNIAEPDEAVDSKAVFGNGGELYMSNENIYWYEALWETQESKTAIRKLSYKDGVLKAVGKTTVDGYINNSFSIDEYDGNLRVATTITGAVNTKETNSIYVLNEELEIIGSIEGLAEEERIYSARFLGEVGYLVTFKQVDPLFTVDFSDPENPEIIGELKIPGFSDYLHFYGEDKLIGIGMDADPETGVSGGVKLSMFDISDQADVKEAHTYTLENVFSTDVFYDYKAVLISEDKNIIGFPAYKESSEIYYVFSYDEAGGFTVKMEKVVNGNGMKAARGVYINDILYVVKGNVIEAYSMKDYNKIDDLIM